MQENCWDQLTRESMPKCLVVHVLCGLRVSQSNMSQVWGHEGNVGKELLKETEGKRGIDSPA